MKCHNFFRSHTAFTFSLAASSSFLSVILILEALLRLAQFDSMKFFLDEPVILGLSYVLVSGFFIPINAKRLLILGYSLSALCFFEPLFWVLAPSGAASFFGVHGHSWLVSLIILSVVNLLVILDYCDRVIPKKLGEK